jgi:hypothetical protein
MIRLDRCHGPDHPGTMNDLRRWMVSTIRVWKTVGRRHVWPTLASDIGGFRLELPPELRQAPSLAPFLLSSLAGPRLPEQPTTRTRPFRLESSIDKHSPRSNRLAEIRLDQKSDNLNQPDLPLVCFQMAARPRLRQLQPHVQFQAFNATTGSPLPMCAGSGWSCLILMGPQN